MPIVVDATYEDGVLKPAAALPLCEHERVRVTIETARSPILEAHGIMGWTGDTETLRRLAVDPEFDPQEG